jgi:hypothetical protein
MRRLIRNVVVVTGLIPSVVGLSGCGGGSGNTLNDFDPKLNKEKGDEYRAKMMEAMKGQKKAPRKQSSTQGYGPQGK